MKFGQLITFTFSKKVIASTYCYVPSALLGNLYILFLGPIQSFLAVVSFSETPIRVSNGMF